MKKYCGGCLNWKDPNSTRDIKFGRCSVDNKHKNQFYECDANAYRKLNKGDINEGKRNFRR